jgi:peptide chain release factor 1
MKYREKLDRIEARFDELTARMADPAVISDGGEYRKISKARSDMEEIVSKFRQYREADGKLEQARGMLTESDPELRELAQLEIEQLEPEIKQIEEDLRVLMLPKDPNDEKDCVLEIRAGTGGGNISHVPPLRRNAALEG